MYFEGYWNKGKRAGWKEWGREDVVALLYK